MFRRRFSLSHEEFMKFGKERLPLEVFFDATQKLSQIELHVNLIIAGFISDDPEIYYTDSEGTARIASHFAVVGEAEYIASASLLRREQDDWTSLEETLYNVFEAKTLAESVVGVGQSTYLSVLSRDGVTRQTSSGIDNQLMKLFEEYGPKPLREGLKFEGEYYFKRKIQ
jgi:20S proteasome alpha/beta subunit